MINEPCELELAEQKLLTLAQLESYPVEVNAIHKNQSLKKSSRIASFSPLIVPGGLVRSNGRIRRRADVEFNIKHPILFDSRHPLVMLLLTFIHQKNQSVDFLRAVNQLEYVVLGLRTALPSKEHHCVIAKK